MNRRYSTYTRDELKERHPRLVAAVDELIATDSKKFHSFKTNYCGRYTHVNGQTRRIQIGQAIEILQENGYDVLISVTKK